MSFWSSILSYTENPLCTNASSQLRPLPEEKPPPLGCVPAAVATTNEDRRAVADFLAQNFGSPPHSPRLRARFSPEDLILVCKDIKDPLKINGCIRLSYAGHFETIPIFVVDCFCIAPTWRKTGLGTHLLMALQREAMPRKMGLTVFLKESAPVMALRHPIYSSFYVFCRNPHTSSHIEETEDVRSLTHEEALRLVAIYKEIYPDTFILCANHVSKNREILWRLWKRGPLFILASFQDSFQIHPQTNSTIGWATGWLESPLLATSSQQDIRQLYISKIISSLPYDWIWADRAWIKPTDSPSSSHWQQDGPFHWYTYQWQPLIRPNGSYIFHV
jgi:GNAT superfamily N-acetyltransferase